jgi:1-acyl-sn-glycerol-3-phosphate acyltransferase
MILALAGAAARKGLWRAVLGLTGGLRVTGAEELPNGPCVIVANHNSHADTAALLAALPAQRRPAVAAAADYWFRGVFRPPVARCLCAAFPVRRTGGGSADLAAAAALLAAGHDVIVYPEGTRSRDGQTGEFHGGAARLAAAAGVPVVPAGIAGTRTLLPPARSGSAPRRSRVTVRFGAPVRLATTGDSAPGESGGTASGTLAAVTGATALARMRVQMLTTDPAPVAQIPVRLPPRLRQHHQRDWTVAAARNAQIHQIGAKRTRRCPCIDCRK